MNSLLTDKNIDLLYVYDLLIRIISLFSTLYKRYWLLIAIDGEIYLIYIYIYFFSTRFLMRVEGLSTAHENHNNVTTVSHIFSRQFLVQQPLLTP